MHKLAGRVERIGDCWAVDGNLNEYARVHHRQLGQVGVHRLVYAEMHPDDNIEGMHVHHICEHPGCINPRHLSFISEEDHRQAHVIVGLHRKLAASPMTQPLLAALHANAPKPTQ